VSAFTVRYAEVDAAKVVYRLIRNPNYGGASCEVPGSCIIHCVERKIKPQFFLQLAKDVKKNGFRNPIVLYNVKTYGPCLSFGGSRLRVAKELGIRVPAIIVDYTKEWSMTAPLVTRKNYPSYFTDPPQHFKFTDVGVDTHYSLERLRRDKYDPAGMEWTKGVEDTSFLKEEFPWL
jgi:hypothetical protein